MIAPLDGRDLEPPAASSTAEADLQRKRLISRALSLVGALLCLTAGLIALAREQIFRGALVLGIGVTSGAAFFLLRRTRRPDWINGPALAGVGALCLYLLATGGTDRSGSVWVMVMPPMLLFALGVRLGGALTAVFLLAMVVVLFFPGDRLLWTDYSLDFKLRILPAVLYVAGISLVFELARSRSQARYEAEIRERRRAERQAEQASLAKTTFLAKMSHELRTPLNGILGLGKLLEGSLSAGGEKPGEARELLQTMLRSGDDLKTLIDELLELSALEASRLRMEPATADLPELCRGVVELLRPRAHEKGLRLACQLDPQAPRFVRVDARRLRQVLLNLLQNAIKFTAQGEVRLELARLGASNEGACLTFRVVDTGPGIRPEHRASVFERFFQGPEAEGRPAGGVGLGLAICREIVRAMGGRIELEERAGPGASFRVELQLPEVERPDTTPVPGATPATFPPGTRVLVAEDDPVSRLVLEVMLGRLGLEVVSVADGQEALARHRAERFDAILMDCKMPLLDGREAARLIRAAEAGLPGGRRTPILAVTAGVTAEEQRSCLEAGMDGVLCKPVDPAQLGGLLSRLLASR